MNKTFNFDDPWIVTGPGESLAVLAGFNDIQEAYEFAARFKGIVRLNKTLKDAQDTRLHPNAPTRTGDDE